MTPAAITGVENHFWQPRGQCPETKEHSSMIPAAALARAGWYLMDAGTEERYPAELNDNIGRSIPKCRRTSITPSLM